MWQSKRKLKEEFDAEYTKQSDPYTYYLHKQNKSENIVTSNEGEHENVPFICMSREKAIGFSANIGCLEDIISGTDLGNSEISKTGHNVYEYGDYLVVESKMGRSSEAERAELVTIAEKLNSDYIYSDIDHVAKSGKKHTPFYKPGFGADTYREFDYFTDFFAVKRDKKTQDITSLENISHVTKPLFHYTNEEDDVNLQLKYYKNNNSYQTDAFYLENSIVSEKKDRISIIIPSKDNPKLIENCLEGIKKTKIKSRINTLEVLIIDNGSTNDNKTTITDVINGYTEEKGLTIKYIYEAYEFNFSQMCNTGVSNSSGEYLLFMNDDIEITDELFLLKLLYYAAMEHVGAVGCKLLYSGDERRIQHVGITCLDYAGPSHKLSTFTDDRVYYFGRNIGVHNVLAVTGACLMVGREKYFKTGGFYDKMKVGYNDVDLCVSLYEKGYMNIVNNECILIHHESISRGADSVSEAKLERLDYERKLLYERHPFIYGSTDPYYNDNLAEDFLDYRVNVIPDFERRDFLSEDQKKQLYDLKKGHTTSKNLYFNIENKVNNRKYVDISGWALINKKENYLYKTYIVLSNEKEIIKVYNTVPVLRRDLQAVFPEAGHPDLSGFFARISKESLYIPEDNDRKELTLSVLVVNSQTGKKYYAGSN